MRRRPAILPSAQPQINTTELGLDAMWMGRLTWRATWRSAPATPLISLGTLIITLTLTLINIITVPEEEYDDTPDTAERACAEEGSDQERGQVVSPVPVMIDISMRVDEGEEHGGDNGVGGDYEPPRGLPSFGNVPGVTDQPVRRATEEICVKSRLPVTGPGGDGRDRFVG